MTFLPVYPFQDPELPIELRVADLVARLTLEEKASQMLHEAPAIERLGIPAYNWWNEALHGVARAGVATVFPQAIGLAAMWDSELMFRIACAISDEARAKHHEYLRQGDRGMYKGLTFWSPNINIFRDPRWGRGHETYGECPYLTARLGVAFCKGLQGDDPSYLKLVATPKHFAVHSGPESLRHSFDARVSLKDLYETYLPAFHACVTEAKAASIMPAYNRTLGEPCAASDLLLRRILRQEWGFDGYVVSDCWAIRDFHEHHGVTQTAEESAALGVKAGCDLNCGCTYERIPEAVRLGLLEHTDLDRCLTRLFSARMRLGMFDPAERVPWSKLPYEVNACPEHRQLALQAARESIVLLKNANGLLPLSKDLGTIAVIGPNAADDHVLIANYYGLPSQVVTPLEGIRARVSPQTRVLYTDGCKLVGTQTDGLKRAGNLSEARSVAERADVVVLVLGLSAKVEGEQDDVGTTDNGGDKVDLELPGLQQRLLEEVSALGKPTILVLIAGSPLSLTWAHQNVPAIVFGWYPGEMGGTALAEVLFGDVSPAGRLPITFPARTSDLPPITDYAMRGRTYRYLEREPLYPFGYGLAFTRFEYQELVLGAYRIEAGQSVEVAVRVCNSGSRRGAEVVQLYLESLDGKTREDSRLVPHFSLRGFRRIELDPGESQVVHFQLVARDLSSIDEQGKRVLEPGRFGVYVGGSQPDARSAELLGQRPLMAELVVAGLPLALSY
ncbi:MAG TPA: glycoside hydrolase family 3 C-terminal domain-containing protein [Polyangiaceae bacterium]|nr:glycoside hydrolase family 3 C-terminal domain-containing protein [Polyangiaceae bacterium]